MFDWSRIFDPDKIGIAKNARGNPDRPACIMPDRTISYGQLDREINILASALQKAQGGCLRRSAARFRDRQNIEA